MDAGWWIFGVLVAQFLIFGYLLMSIDAELDHIRYDLRNYMKRLIEEQRDI